MKITTQPNSETEVAHTFHDTGEPDERTTEATTAELRFNQLGVNVDLIRTLGGVRIGGVFIETHEGKLRVMVWREEDLDSDACATVALYDFLDDVPRWVRPTVHPQL